MGFAHSLHPPIHTHGLADGCPRCEEQAGMPFETLDDDNLIALVERTGRWMNDETEDALARSRNEQRAMSLVEVALVHRRMLDRLIEKAKAA